MEAVNPEEKCRSSRAPLDFAGGDSQGSETRREEGLYSRKKTALREAAIRLPDALVHNAICFLLMQMLRKTRVEALLAK